MQIGWQVVVVVGMRCGEGRVRVRALVLGGGGGHVTTPIGGWRGGGAAGKWVGGRRVARLVWSCLTSFTQRQQLSHSLR